MSRPLLLLGVGETAVYGEFALAQVAAAHPVVLVGAVVPAWAIPYLDGHLPVDPSDEAAVAAAVRRFASSYDVGGVLAYSGEHPVTAARIARRLGLPGNSPQAMAVCSDRVACRLSLAEHKVPVARSAHTDAERAAPGFADGIGYPVVRARARRPVTVMAHDRNEVVAVRGRRHGTAFPRHGLRSGGVLIEEQGLGQGQRVAAQTVVRGDDDIDIVAMARTLSGPSSAQQTVRHTVYAHDPLLHHRLLRQVVRRAVKALGVTLGVLDVQMVLTSRGPHIVHVSPRLADDLIPLLVEQATGISLPQVAADLATGRSPDLLPGRQQAAAVHFAHPSELGHRVVLGTTAEDCHMALDRMVHELPVSVASSAPGGIQVPTVPVH